MSSFFWQLESGVSALSETEQQDARRQFHQIYVELQQLRDFSSVNYTGFSKLLKKHDKVRERKKKKNDNLLGGGILIQFKHLSFVQ